MKDCLKARQVLEYGGENNKFLVKNYSRCIDWIEDVARGLDNKAVSDFITILWNVWNSRNNRIFKGVEEAKEKVWQKLPQGVVKINFDASVHGKKACYGLVAWNSDGFVHGRRMGAIACWSYAGGFALICHLYCLLSLQLCASWCGVAYALMSSLVWKSDVLRYCTV
ncbi:hypothetical protein Gotur_021673 [Gossypium turneri]